MTLKRLHKNILFLISISAIGCLIFYFNLSTRHKAIVKTKALHALHLTNPNWSNKYYNDSIVLLSPTLVIDDLYKSMEGPNAYEYVYLKNKPNKLTWLTGMQVNVLNHSKKIISNDFVCHTNINYPVTDHYARWNLKSPFIVDYARLISTSHGIESIQFPEGFGFPFFTDEKFYVITQTLNHNIKDTLFRVNHKIKFTVSNKKSLKPLRPVLSFIMLPFEKTNLEKESPSKYKPEDITTCIPVDKKNHLYQDIHGTPLSGHWKVFKGKSKYKYNITNMLGINDSIKVHYIIPHLHPFAEKFTLFDITRNTPIYTCNVINHQNKTGLTKTPPFSSKKGVTLYANHQYELQLEVNNTSNQTQDMMASMFLYVYDDEMDQLINRYEKAN